MAHGSPPYQESAFKAAIRLLGAAGMGAASVPQGAGPIEGFGYGFGNALKQSNAARMAAEEYAMKRQATERQTEKDELNRQFLEAEIEKMKRPEKTQKPEKIDPWNMTPEEQERYYRHLEAVERSKARGKPVKTPGTKVPKPPKPMKFPRRIPSGYSEQDIINSIGQETDPANLVPYISGRGGADSEAIRRAAQLRANDIARQAR